MVDREKVIKGLECAIDENHYGFKRCHDCDYRKDIDHLQYVCDGDKCIADAVALLKALDVTPDELERLKMCRAECKIDCLLEHYNNVKDELDAMEKAQEPRVMKVGDVRNWVNSDRVTREPIVIEIRGGVCAWIIDDEVRELPGEADLLSDLYGKTWRCWTSRPTEKQMEATPWN